MEIDQSRNNLTEDSTTIIKLEPQVVQNPSDLPPLVCALKCSAERNAVALNFPGHKRGQAAPSALTQLIGTKPFLHDVIEHPDLDRFFCPKGPLLEAKKLAAELFGAKETWFLVGGTSCGIQAAIMATCSPGDIIILPRNAHVSASLPLLTFVNGWVGVCPPTCFIITNEAAHVVLNSWVGMCRPTRFSSSYYYYYSNSNISSD
ncbi:Arginine decarboxylase [Handroanthus impetiginosus]|uniref:Arginine decarboxylase n=1 Tax=Handroanthus impetiginosus TaxID=429701 RepID=A0A2G9GRH1_9LAMI|nr:Arginine decarboxylase [Handroanthus impetiginosus]